MLCIMDLPTSAFVTLLILLSTDYKRAKAQVKITVQFFRGINYLQFYSVCGEGKAKKDLVGKGQKREKRSGQAPEVNIEEDGDLE